MSDTTFQTLLDEARDLNNEGRFDEARAILESIEAEGQYLGKWRYRLAVALMNLNQFAQAIAHLEAGIQHDPEYPWSYLTLSQLRYWQNEFALAFQTAELGKEKCIAADEDAEEFDWVLRDIYDFEPFINHENWRASVLSNEMPNYDATADAHIKRNDIDTAKQELMHYFGRYERPYEVYTLHIPAKLSERAASQVFESKLDYLLAREKLGTVVAVGSQQNEQRQITACTLKLHIFSEVEAYEEKLLSILQLLTLPKQTQLAKASDTQWQYELGEMDILEIGLDGQNLPDEVYQQYRGRDLLAKMKEAIESGKYIGHQEDKKRTWFYFMGTSFDAMSQELAEILAHHPLCRQALIRNGMTGSYWINNETSIQ